MKRPGFSLIELQIVIVIIVVLSLIALPLLYKFATREKRENTDTLLRMIAATEGGPSDIPRPLVPETRVDRTEDGVRIRQTLPPVTAATRAELGFVQDGQSTSIRVTVPWRSRWLLWPFLGFIVGGIAGGLVFAYGPAWFRREPEPTRAKILVAGILWIVATVLISPPDRVIRVMSDPRQVQIVSTIAGIPWGQQQTHTDVIGIAAVKNGPGFTVVAVVGKGTDRKAIELSAVENEHLGVTFLLKEGLLGQR